MKFRTAFLLIALLSDAKAETHLDKDELTGTAYRHDFSYEDRSATLHEQDDVEDAPSAIITPENGAPPGGGIVRLDPNLLQPKDPAPSWWESCYNWFINLF